jgi:hypothetical protein
MQHYAAKSDSDRFHHILQARSTLFRILAPTHGAL